MNGLLWHCTGRPGDTMGVLGTTEEEANVARVARYEDNVARNWDDREFAQRVIAGLKVKRRARNAGMGSVLAYVTDQGARIAAQGPRDPKANVTMKVNVRPIIAGLEALRDAFNFIDTERYRK